MQQSITPRFVFRFCTTSREVEVTAGTGRREGRVLARYEAVAFSGVRTLDGGRYAADSIIAGHGITIVDNGIDTATIRTMGVNRTMPPEPRRDLHLRPAQPLSAGGKSALELVTSKGALVQSAEQLVFTFTGEVFAKGVVD